MKRVGILDTSLYCCWLKVPGKETAGKTDDAWDHVRVEGLIQDMTRERRTIILPLATIIETGNHISQAIRNRFEISSAFCAHIQAAIDNRLPWAPFVQQLDLWSPERMLKLTTEWPKLALSGMSFADATIKDIADYYSSAGMDVRILTADAHLNAYQPITPPRIPRRAR